MFMVVWKIFTNLDLLRSPELEALVLGYGAGPGGPGGPGGPAPAAPAAPAGPAAVPNGHGDGNHDAAAGAPPSRRRRRN